MNKQTSNNGCVHCRRLGKSWKNHTHKDCYYISEHSCVYCKKHGHLINECTKLGNDKNRETIK